MGHWLADRIPLDPSAMTVRRIGTETDAGNVILEATSGNDHWVIRRPPAVVRNAPGANDMERAYRMLAALGQTTVPHPHTWGLCTDLSGLGALFLVQDYIAGFTAVGRFPRRSTPTRWHAGVSGSGSSTGWPTWPWCRGKKLANFRKPEGFLERQVDRWLRQFTSYSTREIEGMEDVTTWLRAKRAPARPPVIIHGDYSLHNVMFALEDTARLVAIVDWDTSTIGDPLIDFGYLLARWRDPGETLAYARRTFPTGAVFPPGPSSKTVTRRVPAST
jgi:aminoglycoside phosphotransferase (APT) family kinase protein